MDPRIGSLFWRYSQVREISSVARVAAPDGDFPTGPIAQPLHFERRLRCAVHEHTYLPGGHHDLCVKPSVAIRRRRDGFFILAGFLGAELLPRPLRMRDVLHRVTRVL